MEQEGTERLLCATLNGTELSPLGQAIRAQAVRAAARLRAPSEALLRAMGAALSSLLGSPRPDVAYQGARCISSLLPTSPYISLHLPTSPYISQGVRCISSLLGGPAVFLALHTQPALVSLVAQRAELMAAARSEAASADAVADASAAGVAVDPGEAASAAGGAAGGGEASSPGDAAAVEVAVDELCSCALEALLALARRGAALPEELRLLLQLASLPAPPPLKAALLAALGRAERLRWLSHADERAVAVGGEGAEGGAWLDGAAEQHYCANVGCGVAAEQVLPIATVRRCTSAPLRLAASRCISLHLAASRCTSTTADPA